MGPPTVSLMKSSTQYAPAVSTNVIADDGLVPLVSHARLHFREDVITVYLTTSSPSIHVPCCAANTRRDLLLAGYLRFPLYVVQKE
jgi:hypothetical protein